MSEAKNLLDAVAALMGIERHEDGADPEAFLRAVEGAMSAASTSAFLRGQRSARVARGLDPDVPPTGFDAWHKIAMDTESRAVTAEERNSKLEGALWEIRMLKEGMRRLKLLCGGRERISVDDVVGIVDRCAYDLTEPTCSGIMANLHAKERDILAGKYTPWPPPDDHGDPTALKK